MSQLHSKTFYLKLYLSLLARLSLKWQKLMSLELLQLGFKLMVQPTTNKLDNLEVVIFILESWTSLLAHQHHISLFHKLNPLLTHIQFQVQILWWAYILHSPKLKLSLETTIKYSILRHSKKKIWIIILI